MKDGLLALLQLQEVDKELGRLEEAREQYPAEIAVRRKELDGAAAVLKEQEDSVAELAAQQRHLDRELETARVSLTDHEERFAEVTTNREYDALQLEIETCKSGISDYETRILETIDASEAMQEQVVAAAEEFEETRQAHQIHIDELEANLSTLQEEVDALVERREIVIRGIPDNICRVYERSKKRKGMRVAPARKGACGACFRQLPAQLRSDVRRSDRLCYCENCGVILVWDTESS